MKLKNPLIKATLIRRYKRFLADVTLDSGEQITVHTANTGTMMGCSEPGSTVWLSDSKNPKRKYQFSWEVTKTPEGVMVGINTMMSNHLVKEGVENGVITELSGYDNIRQEVTYGNENSRVDLLLENLSGTQKCYVEVKNVTAIVDEMAIFPDAKTLRGVKHLRELISMVNCKHRAVIFFCVQRSDGSSMRPADEIDPVYGKVLREAINSGVEAIAYSAIVTISDIKLQTKIPVILP